MSEPVRPVLAASIAVFRDDGRVLLATRTRPPASGLWSLPGGRVEAGERLGAAALRELHEEVGVTAEIIGFNRHVELIDSAADGGYSHHFVVASFVGRWTGGEARPGPEAEDVRWTMPEEIGALATTAELSEVVASAATIWEAAR